MVCVFSTLQCIFSLLFSAQNLVTYFCLMIIRSSLWTISSHYHFKYYYYLILSSVLSSWNSYWLHVGTLLSVCCASFLFPTSLTGMIPMYLSPGIHILSSVASSQFDFITGTPYFPILKILAVHFPSLGF